MNAADIVADGVIQVPHVRRGHRDVLGEAAVAIDADDLGERANMRVASAAKQTTSVHDVAFRGHSIAFLHVRNEAANLHYITGEFVSDNERRFASSARPSVPVVDVNVGAAHAGATHAN